MTRQTAARTLVAVAMAAALGGCDDAQPVVLVDSEKEANRVLVELERAGIRSPGKGQETRDRKTVWVITTSPDQVSKARQVLVTLDLPREHSGGLANMVEGSGLIPTRTDERARLMYAIASELERTFETYDRVVAARVHVAIPDQDIALTSSAAKPTPTATVLIKHQPDEEGSADKSPAGLDETEIKSIVAKSVEGLQEDDVFVAFTAAQLTPAAAANAASGSASGGTSGGEAQRSPTDQKLFERMLYAIIGLSVFAILLILLLVRKGKRSAPPAAV